MNQEILNKEGVKRVVANTTGLNVVDVIDWAENIDVSQPSFDIKIGRNKFFVGYINFLYGAKEAVLFSFIDRKGTVYEHQIVPDGNIGGSIFVSGLTRIREFAPAGARGTVALYGFVVTTQ